MTKSVQLYGLAKCSTCQKAKQALEAAGFSVSLHDVKDTPLDEGQRSFLYQTFGDKIINRASLTWRGMDEADRSLSPVEMMAKHPSVMKRPAILSENGNYLGWTATVKRAFGVEA